MNHDDQSKKNKIAYDVMIFALLLLGLAGFNVYQTHYDAVAGLTLFFGFIHMFASICRAIIYAILSVFLVLFALRYRKDSYQAIKYLVAIKYVIMIKLVFDMLTTAILIFVIPIHWALIMLIVTLVYHSVMIAYISGLVRYYRQENKALPRPVYVIASALGLIAFLVFHYVYTRQGGTYAITARAAQYMTFTPAIKIALIFLVQDIIIYIIYLIHRPTPSLRLFLIVTITAMIGYLSFGILMVVVEKEEINYRYEVSDYAFYTLFEQIGDNLVDITIKNRIDDITPVGFDTRVDQNYHYNDLDDYLNVFGYGLDNLPSDLPTIKTFSKLTIAFDNNMNIDRAYVYMEDGKRITDINAWYQLRQLDEGIYYVLVSSYLSGDPMMPYADYMFILNVNG